MDAAVVMGLGVLCGLPIACFAAGVWLGYQWRKYRGLPIRIIRKQAVEEEYDYNRGHAMHRRRGQRGDVQI